MKMKTSTKMKIIEHEYGYKAENYYLKNHSCTCFGCFLAGLLGGPRCEIGVCALRVRAQLLPGVFEGLRDQQGQRGTGEDAVSLIFFWSSYSFCTPSGYVPVVAHVWCRSERT